MTSICPQAKWHNSQTVGARCKTWHWCKNEEMRGFFKNILHAALGQCHNLLMIFNVSVSVDLTRSIKSDAEQVEHVQYSFFLRLRWHFPTLLLRHQDVGIIIIEMLKTFRHHNHTWVLKVKNLKPIMFRYEHEALSRKRCRQNELNLSRLGKCYLT